MTNAQQIAIALRNEGITLAGIVAILANLEAESNLMPNNVENRCNMSDEDYTWNADNDTVDFVYDGYGYGIAQWTYNTRKAKLLSMARERGVSVSDLQLQIDLLIYELKNDFVSLYKLLCTSNDNFELCKYFLWNFENPATPNGKTKTDVTMARQSLMAKYEHILDDIDETETTTDSDTYEEKYCVGVATTVSIPTCSTGCRGNAVYALQCLLNKMGYDVKEPTGIFDTRTHNMVMAFQCDNSLTVDGIVGAQTWRYLMYGMDKQ